MHLLLAILILILCANGAPILAQRWFNSSAINRPIDLGYHFIDKKPIFGVSKTWRGLIASLLLTPLFAPLIGLSPLQGFIIASLAMCGDLASSFVKRRCNIPVSGQALGLDQIPESLLPFLYAYYEFQLSPQQLVAGVLLFLLSELLLSTILFRIGIRKRPY